MPIHYACSKCGAEMSIKDDRAGTKAKCPQCKDPFVVPFPEGETREDDPEEGAAVESPTLSLESDSTIVPPSRSDDSDVQSEDSDDGVLRLDPTDDEPDGDDAVPKPHRERSSVATAAPRDAAEIFGEKKRHRMVDRKQATSTANTSSSVADDLLKSTKVEEKSKRKALAADPYGFTEKTEKKADETKPSVGEVVTYFFRTFALPLVGVAAACVLLYWMSSSMMRTRKLPDLGSVTGVVTLDGAPLANADIEFHPVDGLTAGVLKASSFARTDAEGRYTLSYLQDVQGAVVGEHNVQIRALDQTGHARVPPQFNLKTQLKFKVEPGSNTKDWPLSSKAK